MTAGAFAAAFVAENIHQKADRRFQFAHTQHNAVNTAYRCRFRHWVRRPMLVRGVLTTGDQAQTLPITVGEVNLLTARVVGVAGVGDVQGIEAFRPRRQCCHIRHVKQH